jgi:hypothetical protein
VTVQAGQCLTGRERQPMSNEFLGGLTGVACP